MEKIYGENLKEVAQAIVDKYRLIGTPSNGQIARILEARCSRQNLILCAMREPGMTDQLSESMAKLFKCYDKAEDALEATIEVARSAEGMMLDIVPAVVGYINEIIFGKVEECEKEAA